MACPFGGGGGWGGGKGSASPHLFYSANALGTQAYTRWREVGGIMQQQTRKRCLLDQCQPKKLDCNRFLHSSKIPFEI
jgi:hypothetical protein